jgi:hypothetical protein
MERFPIIGHAEASRTFWLGMGMIVGLSIFRGAWRIPPPFWIMLKRTILARKYSGWDIVEAV